MLKFIISLITLQNILAGFLRPLYPHDLYVTRLEILWFAPLQHSERRTSTWDSSVIISTLQELLCTKATGVHWIRIWLLDAYSSWCRICVVKRKQRQARAYLCYDNNPFRGRNVELHWDLARNQIYTRRTEGVFGLRVRSVRAGIVLSCGSAALVWTLYAWIEGILVL